MKIHEAKSLVSRLATRTHDTGTTTPYDTVILLLIIRPSLYEHYKYKPLRQPRHRNLKKETKVILEKET